jgi:alpha-tubulin suppressor-like RCC1 family protein
VNGLVYSQGSNSYGQLGLGFRSKKPIKDPQIITYFQKNKEIIEAVSVGMSHCVAKSKLGYIFAWGSNCFKQFSYKNVDYV